MDPVTRLDRTLDLAGVAAEMRRPDQLGADLWPRVGGLLGADTLVWCDADGTAVGWPPAFLADTDVAAFERWAPTYPLAVLTRRGAGTPRRRSDVMTDSEFRAGPVYTEVFRRLGVRHQLAVALPGPGGPGCLALNRGGRDFADREVDLLALLRPHLAAAVRRSGRPDPVARLTPGERQVLARVARGGTDRAVARELGVTPRTVGKHLENAYLKLGVHDRTSAVLQFTAVTGVDTTMPAPRRVVGARASSVGRRGGRPGGIRPSGPTSP